MLLCLRNMHRRILILLAALLSIAGCATLLGIKPVDQAFAAYATKTYQAQPELYAVNARKNKVLYIAPETSPPEIYLYHRNTDTAERIRTANPLPGVDKITYDNGAFRVWYQGSGLAEVVVDRRSHSPKAPARVAESP